MLFTDEEARHKFHTSSTILQVCCQMLESELVMHHLQLEFVDIEHGEDYWEALLVVGSPEFEDSEELQAVFEAAVEAVDARFVKADGTRMVTACASEYGLVTVKASDDTKIAHVN
jgi:hypothetical protein